MTQSKSTQKEVNITRLIDAPREIVFRAWTDTKHMAQWWGPEGFSNPVCEMDVKPGGAILIHMKGPDGTIYPMSGKFREVSEPGKLIFSSTLLDEAGTPMFEVLNTITFSAKGGQTELKVHAVVTSETEAAAPYLQGMDEGWKQTLDRMANHAERMTQ
jgi:uncharacterized protein YndB with AHSA1/START domain